MKIEQVEAIPLAVPPKPTSEDVPWVWGRLNQVVVRIRTDDGLEGWGDAFAYGVVRATTAVINDTLAPLLVGEDPRDITGLTRKLFQRTHIFGRYGITTFAISGVEIALWDLAGKRAGKPLYELLGGADNTEVPAYASLVRYEEESDAMVAATRQALDEGYTMIKLHQVSEASVALAREEIGDEAPLTVDINCEWSPLRAIFMAQAMDEYELYWLEEPVWPPEDYKGLARAQRESGVPLAAGENACTAHQFQLLMEAGAVSYVQPSVIKVGGIGEFLKVAQLAESFGMELAPHSPYFGPGFVATLHLIAHTAKAPWVERIYFDLETSLFTEPPAFEEAVYTLPEGPGLGVEVNPDVIKEYRLKD